MAVGDKLLGSMWQCGAAGSARPQRGCAPEKGRSWFGWLLVSILLLLSPEVLAVGSTTPANDLLVTKWAGSVEPAAATSYRVPITVRLENRGTEKLFNVQLSDAISPQIAPATVLAVTDLRISGALSGLDRTFDGIRQVQLLTGTEKLVPGQVAVVRFWLQFDAGAAPGPFENVASGWSNDRSGGRVDDFCTEQRRKQSIKLPEECAPASIELPDEPLLGLAKRASESRFLSEARGFETTLSFQVENLGTTTLENLQICDDLAETFRDAADFEVQSVALVSGSLTVNTGFDGRTDPCLLSGKDQLAAGSEAALNVRVRFLAADATGVFFNRGKASASGIWDLSTNGADPDPDGNGRPEEDEPTPIHYAAPTGVIGLAKAASESVPVEGDVESAGWYQTRLRFTVENFSDVTLHNVQIVDDLSAAFGSGVDFEVLAETFEADNLIWNAQFDGHSRQTLLLAGGSLGPRAVGSVAVSVRFRPEHVGSPAGGTFTNHALATADGTEDESVPGADPDPDGDGVPDESGGTDIRWQAPPVTSVGPIGLANAATPGVWSAELQRFQTTLSYVIENFGDEPLSALTLSNDLRQTFIGTAEFLVVAGPSSPAGGLHVNADYDGRTELDLLHPDSVIEPGERLELSLAVSFDPGTEPSPFLNQASIQGQDKASGKTVSDLSTLGSDPDPDMDQLPLESVPTPIPFNFAEARLGVAKTVEGILPADSGFDITFFIVLKNLGPVPIRNVQVMDNLSQTFPAPVTTTLSSGPELNGALTEVNGGFGIGSSALLSGAETLNPGASAGIRFTVHIELNGAEGPFFNQALGTGIDPDGEPVMDDSDSGDDPDSDDDGDPGGPGEDDPTPIDLPAGVEIRLYQDLDHDRMEGPDDLPVSGWRVEIRDPSGELVFSGDSGEGGRLTTDELTPGAYRIRVRNPVNGVVWSSTEVILEENEQRFVAVPLAASGVVYASASRRPVVAARLSLVDTNGVRLPVECLLEGQQGQHTDSAGAYRFSVQFGAAVECADSQLDLQISVDEAPGDLSAEPSTRIPPESETLLLDECAPESGLPCVVQSQPEPPAAGADTRYFLSLGWGSADEGIANNHIPLDEPEGGGDGSDQIELVVRHSVNPTRASVGDVVGYSSTVENRSTSPAADVTLRLDPPAGLTAVEGSLVVESPGSDGIPGTPDDVIVKVGVADPRGFDAPLGDLEPGVTMRVRYAARVTPAVNPGVKLSKATGMVGAQAADSAAASLLIESDPLFEKTTVIGKVFHDMNGNGVQEDTEPGIPGVRLATLDGLVIETDHHGRYHLADVDTGSSGRGANFMIKLDNLSLPQNRDASRVQRQVVRLTPGLMTRINFPVRTETRDPENSDPADPPIENRTNGLELRPRLDVLALDEIVADGDAEQVVDVRFAFFSNYHHHIQRYALTLYDVTDSRFPRELHPVYLIEDDELGPGLKGLPEQSVALDALLSRSRQSTTGTGLLIPDPAHDLFERSVAIRLQPGVQRLAYRLTAFGHCDPSYAALQDQTELRLLDVLEPSVIRPASRPRFASEIFGHSSLSQQNILVRGDRNLATRFAAPYLREGPELVGPPELKEEIQPIPLPGGESTLLGKELAAVYGVVESDTTRDTREIRVNEDKTWAVFNHRGLSEEESGFVEFEPDRKVVADRGSYQDEPAATGVHEVELTCGCTQFSAETIIDEESSSLSLRLTNLGPYPETPELAIVPDNPAYRPLQSMETGGTQEVFLGRFDANGFRSDDSWQQVRVRVGPADEQNHTPEFRLKRVRRGGEYAPDIEALCANVSARPHTTTEDNRLASMIVSDLNENEDAQAKSDDPWFGMALVNLTGGSTSASGDSAALSAGGGGSGPDDVYLDGRIAAYVKGRIAGKYQLTAQIDSTEDALKNLGDNLRRQDPERIFRQLDPDRYYPTYGDDSTTVADVNSQGAMYLRLDWDQSTAMWGNFNTTFTGTEFSQYNRSLYGANLDYRSTAANQFGEARRSLKVFGSEAQTLSAHASYRATGGSLYYLPHRDIVQGSEKLWIEVRGRDSSQVLDTQILMPGRDYEIDDIQGRIILARPLAYVIRERANPIIHSVPLEGDRVFLLADYEHVSADFETDALTSGARGKWSTDRFSVGVTSVTDQRDGSDYDLLGSDVMLRLGDRGYLRGEFATSEAAQNDLNALSLDGGLTFQDQQLPDDAIDGDAWGLELKLDLAEISHGALQARINQRIEGELKAWHKHKDSGFSAGRLGDLGGFEDTGFNVDARLNETLTVGLGAAQVEREIGLDETNARAQADYQFGCGVKRCYQFGIEGRYERSEADARLPLPAQDRDGLLVGARLGREFDGGTTVYGSVQTVLDKSESYPDNELVSVGATKRLTDHFAVSMEGRDGDRGSALMGGVEYVADSGAAVNLSGGVGAGATTQFGTRYTIADGHELYGTHTMDPDRTDGARNMTTLGQRSQLGSRTNLFTETTFGRAQDYADTAHVFGLDYELPSNWLVNASVQASTVETELADIERRVFSVGSSYRDSSRRFATRLEVRTDKSDSLDTRQYLTSTRFGLGRPDSDDRWIGKLNLAWTDNAESSVADGRFVELDLGYAYRPSATDSWNALAKYSFLYDLGSNGQLGPNGRLDEQLEERSHVASAELLFDVGGGVELGGKLAGKIGEQRVFAEGSWHDTRLAFGALRVRYRLPGGAGDGVDHHWEALAEYRMLKDFEDSGLRSGALLGIYKSMANGRFKVGVGYNFTDFDGDLRGSDYRSEGLFLDFSAAY